MLIYRHQINEINKVLRKRYILTLITHIETEFSERYLMNNVDYWIKWVDEKLDQCEHFGIIEQDDILDFIDITLEYPVMESRPMEYWIDELLSNASREVEDRLFLLEEKLMLEDITEN